MFPNIAPCLPKVNLVLALFGLISKNFHYYFYQVLLLPLIPLLQKE